MRNLVLFSLALCATLSFPVLASDKSHANQNTHPAPLPSLEVAGATDRSFGNGTVVVPIWKGLLAEGVWYHSQGRNIGFGGAGYAFRPHHSVILIPSLYAVRGNGEHDTVALGFRALIESRRFLADINVIRTFGGGGKGEDRDIFVDPSHVSLREKKLQLGYAVEFFRHIGQNHTAGTHTAHSPNEWLHGPRFGWEASSRVHVFYMVLKKNGYREHKIGISFFFADLLRKKK